MPIPPLGARGIDRAGAARTPRRAGAASFHIPDPPEAAVLAQVAPLADPAPPAEHPDQVADRAARQHGQDLLAELSRLQRDLLGPAGPGRLARLQSLAGSAPAAADPGLAEILDAITLRAQVELARRLQP